MTSTMTIKNESTDLPDNDDDNDSVNDDDDDSIFLQDLSKFMPSPCPPHTNYCFSKVCSGKTKLKVTVIQLSRIK